MSQKFVPKILPAFRKALTKQGKHPNTVKSYLADVRQFHTWARNTLGLEYTVDEVTKGDVQDFRGFLLTRNSPATSVNRRLTALRQFFEYCVTELDLKVNPVADVAGIHSRQQAPLVLTRKEALHLIRGAESYKHPLETITVLLLLHGGLRSSEICGLLIGDMHLSPREARLFIRGQSGKKTRFVHLTTRTQAALRQYCNRRGLRMISRKRRGEPLFTQRNGKPLTQQVIDHIIKRIGKLAGIPSVTPTMLRNTCAVQMLLSGDSEDKVARALGMASVKNLVQYVEELQNGETKAQNNDTASRSGT